jgi:hypothetical protein
MGGGSEGESGTEQAKKANHHAVSLPSALSRICVRHRRRDRRG